MALRVGTMRHKVELQHRTLGTADAYGAKAATYATYAPVWGARLDLRAREFIASRQAGADINTRLVIHYRADVVVTDRAIVDGVTYEVVAPPAEVVWGAGLELLLRVVQ